MDASAVFVADGAPGSGLGHISRSSAVAVALATRGVASRCYALGALEPFERDGVRWLPGFPGGESTELLVLDSYGLTHEDLDALPTTEHLVVLSEEGATPSGVGVHVDVAGDPAAAGHGRLYGFEYACLRPAFWGLPRRVLRKSPEQILVTTGAGDGNGLAGRVAAAVARAAPSHRVTLVVGPYASRAQKGDQESFGIVARPESLLSDLLRADVVVSAAGQTVLEAAATGAPTVAFVVAENQRRQAARLAALGAVRLVDGPVIEAVARAVVDLLADERARSAMSRRAQQAVDGYGALRIAFAIAGFVSPADAVPASRAGTRSDAGARE